MATITFDISDDVHQKLQKRADELHRDLSAVVSEILETGLHYGLPAGQVPKLSKEEKLKAFKEWVESHPKIDVQVDDSRETIYEGR